MAAPAHGATDVLTLGADWEPQGSDGAKSLTRITAGGNDGDIVAEDGITATNAGTARYIYIGEETAFAAACTAAACWPGMVLNSLLITGMAIDYTPCAQGKRPVVTFTFRDGPTSADHHYLTALVLPTSVAGGVTVPDLLTLTAGDSETTNNQWGLAGTFGEDLDKDGEFLAGELYGGEETINLTTVGVPTSVTSTGWVETQAPSTTCPIRSNVGYNEGIGHTYIRKVTRTATV
jgi:hypothetical protein